MHVQPASNLPLDPWSALYDRIAIGVLALVALLALLTFRDYGLGWDDYTHSQHGDLLLALYGSGFRDTRALSFVNLYMYGGGFDMAAALLAKVLPFDLFETRRLTGAIVGLIGLAVTWRIGRRVGSPLTGLLALVLLAVCPLYYGHMFINPKDAPFAVAMAVLLLGLVRALETYPRIPPATTLLLGLGFGLSIGSRIMGGFGVITMSIALGLIVFVQARTDGWRASGRNLGAFIVALVPAVILAVAAMALIWPWAVADPLNPIRAIGYFAHFFEKPWKELFQGALIEVPDMPRSYVPVLFGLQMPEIFLMLCGTGLIGTLIAAFASPLPLRRRAMLLAVALAALLPLLVAVATRPAMYNGIRHFVFVLPPLAVAGGLAGALIAARARTLEDGRVASWAVLAVLLAGLALPVIHMARLHPYQYAYFNPLAGGVAGARDRYMLDYWGLSFKQAAQGLLAALVVRGETPPAGRKWKIAVCGPHPPAAVALGDRFEPTWEPKGADFALMLGEFYCARLDAPVLAEVTREGATFARAYDLRGRDVPGLFTIPPVEREEQR
jgi:4-amino-4-deoxy-L-arabinose transferase-like glycosyltransferase